MEFHPLLDYGKFDLKNERNLVYWKFGELIKTLITLSSNSERQFEIIGYGAVCCEMAEDFDLYFTLMVDQYRNFNLLTNLQLEKLEELDLFFDNRSGDKSPDFWDDFLLETSHEWDLVRNMAKDILKLLKMEDLQLEIEREEKFEETNKGRKLIMQCTKIRLIKK
ncbi:hypothetical protein [Flavobacterium sp. KACC 22761]|uniref:hypothetical protein n=1 Tax=Flavobacterium sp. KACC 22761 TaxID=3092665 RepID=UPI002A74AF95|nr:hypothetical protein [Flavobacterium sp. KACC 22761]WPO78955.1 hypothetical protein SCB73_00905 [Flavobacterium sp. KACC 22761]